MRSKDCRLCYEAITIAQSEEEALCQDGADCYLDDESHHVSDPQETASKCPFYDYSDVYPRS